MMPGNFQLRTLSWLFALVFGSMGWAQDKKSGALILVSIEGEVEFFDALGEPNEQKIGVGGVVPKDFSIATGAGSSVLCLFSNGTLMTLTEKTRMKVGVFKQEPFDPNGRELKDLVEEPSSSEVVVDLDFGSLVVKTKKLNKSSSFDIHSPLGTAGIRGTEFQMALDPSQGVQLDVTESTVAFSPPGGGQPVPVSQGSGLSVSPTGAVTQRPVNPVAAQQISTTNQAATEVSAELSMDTVSAAMEQATVEASAEEGGAQMEESSEEPAENEESAPVEEEATMEESSSEEPAEESGAESETGTESESGGMEEPAAETESSAGGESSEASAPEESSMESTDSGGSESTSGESGSASTAEPSTEVASAEGGGTGESNAGPSAAAPDPVSAEPVAVDSGSVQSSALENNSELTVARKTGKFDEFTRDLAKFGLTDEQTLRFYEFSEGAKLMVLMENSGVVDRLLKMNGFGKEQADQFYSYTEGVREKILGLEDVAMVPLINQRIDEALLDEALTTMNLDFSNSKNLPDASPEIDSLESRTLALNELFIKHGNEKIMEELIELSQGKWTEEWIEVGEFAGELLQDRMIGATDAAKVFQAGKVLNSPFYEEVASLYRELELEMLVAGETEFLAGRNLIVGNNAEALSPYFGTGAKSLTLSASQDLQFTSDLEWEASGGIETRLVIMSAGAMEFAPGMSLSSATSDLVIASRQDLKIEQVTIQMAKEIAVRGMRDVSIQGVTLGTDALARIKARRNLEVDGLNFSRDVSRIVLEATTMRLSNINFPAASAVQLNSLKGPIDGRYPNFGTSIPAAQQMGRVNFIDNIRSGGNPIMNRPSFDQFGGNISIGKIAGP